MELPLRIVRCFWIRMRIRNRLVLSRWEWKLKDLLDRVGIWWGYSRFLDQNGLFRTHSTQPRAYIFPQPSSSTTPYFPPTPHKTPYNKSTLHNPYLIQPLLPIDPLRSYIIQITPKTIATFLIEYPCIILINLITIHSY